jgi:hypothetical protein
VPTLFADDAGTHSNSEVTVIAGFIGSTEQGAGFEIDWIEKLRNPAPGRGPLKRFHMTECEAGFGEFAGWSPAERVSEVTIASRPGTGCDPTGM